jgi:hypothetical protein
MQSTRHHDWDIGTRADKSLFFPVFAFPTDKTKPLPIEAIIAACVVVFLTLCFGLLARRERLMQVTKYSELLR